LTTSVKLTASQSSSLSSKVRSFSFQNVQQRYITNFLKESPIATIMARCTENLFDKKVCFCCLDF